MTQEEMKTLAETLKPMIKDTIQEELKPINQRLDKIEIDIGEMKSDIEGMKEYIEVMKESLEEVRCTTNESAKWINTYFNHKYPYPV